MLLRERIRHTNRIRGLLFGQGITNYNPLHTNRRKCLEQLRTGDGRPVPAHLKVEILREIDRLELVLRQISEVEAERDELLRPAQGLMENRAARKYISCHEVQRSRRRFGIANTWPASTLGCLTLRRVIDMKNAMRTTIIIVRPNYPASTLSLKDIFGRL
jgi:hypothetical protein